ncbi:MAG TPA: DUF4907 domain-containing protein [Bacteroidales bacterium]|nr:DUF4907 domain-containing protein [Bacteroidales bacterium]
MMKIKKIYYLTAIILAVTLLLTFSGRDEYSLKTFRSDNGWGYSISKADRTIIKQPFIPALEGKRPFYSKHDARITGNLVLQRLKAKADFTLSHEDLLKAGIKLRSEKAEEE